MSPEKSIFEDDFPFPKVGYVSFVEGNEHESLIGGLGWWFGFLESPYERGCYIGVALKSQTTNNPNHPTSPISWQHGERVVVDSMLGVATQKSTSCEGRDGFGGGHDEAGNALW